MRGRTRELVTPFPEVLSLRPQKSAQASTAFEPRRVVKQPSSASGGDLWRREATATARRDLIFAPAH
ncbi:hypothetical protein MUK42_34831 [Musa troglodytarum]|uniref:Uncharacterized protein n=1 Tax=Musa troglodytarum TaxID=320322 RepID=A0A9E7EEK8_9LILI|nr:hypothetical protein MUK42_34831 [Musa troglodytarum]